MGGPARGGGARARQPAVDRGLESPEPRPHRARRAARPARASGSAAAGWHVIELRWGSRLRALFAPARRRAAARAARGAWRNAEYQSLLRLPRRRARARRCHRPRRARPTRALDRLLARHLATTALGALVADVGGHDLGVDPRGLRGGGRGSASGPCVILADTIKGWGYRFARRSHEPRRAAHPGARSTSCAPRSASPPATEWAGFAPGSAEAALIRARARAVRAARAPARRGARRARRARRVLSRAELDAGGVRPRPRPARPPARRRPHRHALRRRGGDHASRGVDQSQGRLLPARAGPAPFAEVPQAVQWKESPAGQHIELGIAEHNLFLALGAFGLTARAVRRDAAADRHALRSLRHARARRALPRALRGRALHRGRDARRA